jgi:hypothetical protein
LRGKGEANPLRSQDVRSVDDADTFLGDTRPGDGVVVSLIRDGALARADLQLAPRTAQTEL